MNADMLELNEQPVIFGLTYLEEEAAEINDVVGCLMPADDGGHFTMTGCDDSDWVGGGGDIP